MYNYKLAILFSFVSSCFLPFIIRLLLPIFFLFLLLLLFSKLTLISAHLLHLEHLCPTWIPCKMYSKCSSTLNKD